MDIDNTNGLVVTNHQPSGGSSLPNQGQIDWVALANTTVSASVDFLSRMSGAGVNPFTIAVGQAVALKFQMSRLGIHRLETAIKNLQYTSMIGEMLWFGFGINHIIRSLMHTTEGATLVMLCSILSETRTTGLSARVLYELTTTYNSTSSEATRLTPSLQQWQALVKVCAGCLSTTPFGTIVDQMVTLMSHKKPSDPGGGHDRHVGNPKDVALVLNALGRLSSCQLFTLTISGGYDCGWIAAVAYWFFDIAVEFREANGHTVYPLGKHHDASSRTLVVVQASKGSTDLQTIGEAYSVADITREIVARDLPRDESPFNVNDLQTRIPWHSVLRQTFGEQASTLLRLKDDFGTAVGSASRMFLEFAKPQVDVSAYLPLSGWDRYGSASYGLGFLHFVCRTFPEMASSMDTMETAAQSSFTNAVATYQTIQERLRSTCECRLCRGGTREFTDPGVRGRDLCLITLCGFAIQLALDLSVTSIPPELYPTRSGLELLYRDYSANFSNPVGEDYASGPLVSNIFREAWNQMTVLFTGSETITNISSSKGTLAFVKEGLCVYRGVLHRLSDRPEEMLRTLIIPGCIKTRTGRVYDTLNGTPQFDVPVFNYDASPAIPCVTMPAMPSSPKEKYEVSAVVEETMINLTTHFIVKKSPNMSVVCSPPLLVCALQGACGFYKIPCSRQGCPKIDIAVLSVATIEGEGRYEAEALGRSGCKIGLRLVGDNPIARLMALLVLKTYRRSVPGESRSRTDEVARDGKLDYGDPVHIPIHDSTEEFRREGFEDDQFHTRYEAEADESTNPLFDWDSRVILQRDECLPCTIRKAVAVVDSKHYKICIVCR
ncbi:MAG: hypothetical protein Q9209_005771 [Squamulea sp. 1 TL-2023]